MKSTAFIALALLAATGVQAQTAKMYEGVAFDKNSPNGKWLAENNQGSLSILNAATDDTYSLYDEQGLEMYSPGLGNSLSNTGKVCGFTMKHAFLWADDELSYTALAEPSGVGTSFNGAQGFTPDESRIVGALGSKGASLTTDGMMCYPVYWEKNAAGTYDIHTLPYLAKDFAGGTPQSVIAVCVSDDGHTVVGTLVSWSGRYKFPIVFKEDSEGNWTYTLLGKDNIYDESRLSELPELPAEPVEPAYKDYMSEDDLVDYEAALEDYQTALSNYNNGITSVEPTYPVVSDYISDATKKEEYIAAATQYVSDHKAWENKWKQYANALDGITTGASFKQNNLWLSPNGQYLATSLDRDGVTYPGYFDLTEESPVFHECASGEEGMLATGVLNDGTVFAASPVVEKTRFTFVFTPEATAPVSFHDYLATRSEEMAKWLADNNTFTVAGTDSIVSGTVHVGGNGDVFVAYYANYYDGSGDSRSYVIDMTATNGIHNTSTATQQNAATGVFDLTGRRIATQIEDVHQPGVYVVRQNDKTTKKSIVR